MAGRDPSRRLSLAIWILPLARVFAHLHIEGREHLRHVRRSGGLRVQSPEPHGCSGNSGGVAGSMARARGPGDGEGILQGAFLPRGGSRGGIAVTSTLLYYLAAFYFNAFPLPQREAGARQTLAHRRSHWCRLVDPDLSRGRARRFGADAAVPWRHRDDRIATGSRGGSGANRGRGSHPPPDLADGPAGPGANRVRRSHASQG